MADQEESSEEPSDKRRVYYDHEPAYEAIVEAGGRGWDDLPVEQRGLSEDEDALEADSYAALERFLASDWAPKPGCPALELGCGGGQATLALAEHGYEATGVDFSETAIELAKQNADDEEIDAEFVVGGVTDLGEFDDGQFGLIVDNHCLHCLIEPEHRQAMLREAERLLYPGGVFFSETMTREGIFDAEKLGVDTDTWINEPKTRIFVSKIELDEELRAANFNVIHTYTRHSAFGLGFGLCFVNYGLAR
jgi:SAM-dependent methyltransferase